MINHRVLFAIGSIFGRPLQVDQAIASLTRPSLARILVEIDITKQFPKDIWLGSDLNGYYQEVQFENFPTFCSHCKLFGHLHSHCYALHPYLRKKKDVPNNGVPKAPSPPLNASSNLGFIPSITIVKPVQPLAHLSGICAGKVQVVDSPSFTFGNFSSKDMPKEKVPLINKGKSILINDEISTFHVG